VNRQRLKEKIKTEKAEQEKLLMEQEKLLMEQEISSAKEQMRMFTDHIIEKTNLIEKLELQVKNKEVSSEQHLMILELSQQTILTEEDWLKFKTLFEKIYPGFFTKLKEQVSDITLAEQRMAALTRLHLTTKQMAAVLGISPNSVIKAKQRLRQRFNFQTDFHVEEFLARL
jgi:DNA-binding CsgD family transcriptional regulator